VRLLVANNAAPFVRGGAELLADRLVAELQKAGHEAELLRIPLGSTPEQITDSILAAATLDVFNVDRVIGLNIHAAFAICRAAAPVMRRAGQGSMINTTSIAARTGGSDGAGLYGAAKAFVSTMTRVFAREMAPHGVRVNGVAPGVILTDFHVRNSTPEQLEGARRGIPMGRLGTADECVGAYLFLADDVLSGYITGQIIEVNGGQLMP